MRSLLTSMLALSLAGCVVGQRPSLPTLALSPGGRDIYLDTRWAGVQGELLAVEASAFVVRTAEPTRIVTIPFGVVTSGRISGYRDISTQELGRFAQRDLARYSRYPQGIDESLRAALLAAYGLAAVEEFEQ
jgi:hypothetical protein